MRLFNRTAGDIRDRTSRVVLPMTFLTVLLIVAGCTDLGTDLGFRDIGGVQVTPMATELVVENETSTRIHRFIVGQNLVPVIDWVPACTDANAIDAGKNEHLAYQTILGYASGTNLVVYWWHSVAGKNGTLGPDSIRTIVVKTP